MMNRWRRTLLLLLPMILLVGCAQKIDQQAQRLGLNKRVANVGARVDTDLGILTIYRYTQTHLMQPDFCGVGFTLQGGGGSGELPCATMGALTWMTQTNGNLAILAGRVNNPEIVKVILSDESGQQLTATVGDGVWYLLAPGANPPTFTKVEGLDQRGNVLHTLPMTGP
jgi:hypothetical protein